MKKQKSAKEKLLTFLLIFTFSVENEFSCKEIPHINKHDGKAFADDIIFVNGDQRAEHGISDKKACRLKDIVFGERGDDQLGKPQTDNADHGKTDEIGSTAFDFGFGEHPERRNDVVDSDADNKAEYNRPCFRHFKEFLAENYHEHINDRGKTAYKNTAEELNGGIACFLNKECVKEFFHS